MHLVAPHFPGPRVLVPVTKGNLLPSISEPYSNHSSEMYDNPSVPHQTESTGYHSFMAARIYSVNVVTFICKL